MSQLSGRPGSSSCSTRPASRIALYSSLQRVGESVEEFLVAFVVLVLPAGEAAGRDGGDEPFLRLHRRERRLEIGDVGFDGLLPDIAQRAGDDGRPPAHRARREELRRVELTIKILEDLPVAPARKRGQRLRRSRLPAAEPSPGIALPRAVIDRAARRLAELAVVDDIDADFGLVRGQTSPTASSSRAA